MNINGRGAAWCDGVFSGDQEIVKHARKVVDAELEVDVRGLMIPASADSAVGAFAAMFSYNPDQAVLVEAPDEVFEVELEGISWDNPGSWE